MVPKCCGILVFASSVHLERGIIIFAHFYIASLYTLQGSIMEDSQGLKANVFYTNTQKSVVKLKIPAVFFSLRLF